MTHSTAALVSEQEDGSLTVHRMMEIASKDLSAVRKAHQKYLGSLKKKGAYDDSYQEQSFSNYEAFSKSAYGKLNLFAQHDKNKEVIVLKFRSEEDAQAFIKQLQSQGVQCKIIDQASLKDNQTATPRR